MLDIDHFKAINERFGHAAGDAVLCVMVQTFQNVLRSLDIVVRWGGEEFCWSCRKPYAAEEGSTAERLRAAVESTEVVSAEGDLIQFTVSVGVARPASDVPSDLLSRADGALYAAKRGGRNRVIFAPRPVCLLKCISPSFGEGNALPLPAP